MYVGRLKSMTKKDDTHQTEANRRRNFRQSKDGPEVPRRSKKRSVRERTYQVQYRYTSKTPMWFREIELGVFKVKVHSGGWINDRSYVTKLDAEKRLARAKTPTRLEETFEWRIIEIS